MSGRVKQDGNYSKHFLNYVNSMRSRVTETSNSSIAKQKCIINAILSKTS